MKFSYKNKQLLLSTKRFDVCSIEGENAKRAVVIHPGAAAILPFIDAEKILLIRNVRESVCDTLWEVPAGTLENLEPPIECAQRELIEETGYEAGKIAPLTQFFVSPGYCNEMLYVFVAHDLKWVGQNLNETEEIEVVPTPFKTALEMIEKGTIVDAKTICALLFYKQFF